MAASQRLPETRRPKSCHRAPPAVIELSPSSFDTFELVVCRLSLGCVTDWRPAICGPDCSGLNLVVNSRCGVLHTTSTTSTRAHGPEQPRLRLHGGWRRACGCISACLVVSSADIPADPQPPESGATCDVWRSPAPMAIPANWRLFPWANLVCLKDRQR